MKLTACDEPFTLILLSSIKMRSLFFGRIFSWDGGNFHFHGRSAMEVYFKTHVNFLQHATVHCAFENTTMLE